jgi:hypothetical protein
MLRQGFTTLVNAISEACVDVLHRNDIKQSTMQTENINRGTMEEGVGALRLMQWHSAVIAKRDGLRTHMCNTSMQDLSGGDTGGLLHKPLATLHAMRANHDALVVSNF